MTRALFMGAPFRVEGLATRNVTESFDATGKNTGNLLIGYGLAKQLSYETVDTYCGSMTPGEADERFDQVVIAAANFLYPGFDFGYMARFLERTKLPVFMVGLGAQLPSRHYDLKAIPEGTWRLVQIASERAHSIGVRGEFTAALLKKAGIRNVEVAGCPSLYMNLTDAVSIRRPASLVNVAFNGSRNVVTHSFDIESARRVERQLLTAALSRGAPYVLQNEFPEMQIATGADPEGHRGDVSALSKFFGVPAEELIKFWRTSAHIYFSVENWFEWIRTMDFCLGTRFHGNVAAILNGVPSVVITHDSRTEELCEFAAIPNVPVSAVDSVNPDRLYRNANYDNFEQRYPRIFADYSDFLDRNHIPHRLVRGSCNV